MYHLKKTFLNIFYSVFIEQIFLKFLLIKKLNYIFRTSLMESILKNNIDVFNFIVLHNNTDVNIKNNNGKTALELALLEQRNLYMSEKLITERNAEFNYANALNGTKFLNYSMYYLFF